MKSSFLKLSLAAILLTGAFTQSAFAQTGVGIGTATPATAAKLDVTSTTQGFLPPRMSQAQMTAIASPVAGLTVWCNDCSPVGLWNYNGTAWVSVGANNLPTATFTPATLNCTGTLSGTYSPGVAMTASNKKVVTIDVATPGSYMAMTNTANGVTFTSTSAFFAAGNGGQVTLGASGTPLTVGTFTYTVMLGGQTCTFNVTFNLAATFNCGGATQTQTPTGSLVNNTAYTGSYSIPYTAGNNAAYATTTQTSNGLTFTRTAGTYLPGGGTVVYNLNGTYTGATNGTVTFTTPECGGVIFGDAIRGALAAAGCASCAAYDAAAVNSWLQISAAEYAAVGATANIAGVGKYIGTDAALTNTVGSVSNTATNSYLLQGTSPIPASNYVVAFATNPVNNISGGTAKIKIQTTNSSPNGPTVDYGGLLTLPASSPSNTIVYYVIKRPTVSTFSGSASFLGIYSVSNGGFFGVYSGGSANSNAAVGSGAGDQNTFPGVFGNYTWRQQVLSTAQKQW